MLLCSYRHVYTTLQTLAGCWQLSLSWPSDSLCLDPFLTPVLLCVYCQDVFWVPSWCCGRNFRRSRCLLCFLQERNTWSQSRFCITILSLLWDEKDGILCCTGDMTGFVVQRIMKGSCPISRHTLLCGGGKAWLWVNSGSHLVRS